MFRFLETNLREQKKYEKRIQTSMDNTINDMSYEIKFESRVKDKNNFFYEVKHCFSILNKNAFYSWRRIFLRFLRI